MQPLTGMKRRDVHVGKDMEMGMDMMDLQLFRYFGPVGNSVMLQTAYKHVHLMGLVSSVRQHMGVWLPPCPPDRG